MRRRMLLFAVVCGMTIPDVAPAQRPAKPVLHGRHWAALTGNPLAATAGAMMFQRGGNAVDAACAMLAAVATMWDVLSWGGETQALIFNPNTGKVLGINALGVAPTGATAELYRERGHRHPPEEGPLAAVTPGTPGGLTTMLAEWGTLSLAEVLAPAMEMAEGYPMEGDAVRRVRRSKMSFSYIDCISLSFDMLFMAIDSMVLVSPFSHARMSLSNSLSRIFRSRSVYTKNASCSLSEKPDSSFIWKSTPSSSWTLLLPDAFLRKYASIPYDGSNPICMSFSDVMVKARNHGFCLLIINNGTPASPNSFWTSSKVSFETSFSRVSFPGYKAAPANFIISIWPMSLQYEPKQVRAEGFRYYGIGR